MGTNRTSAIALLLAVATAISFYVFVYHPLTAVTLQNSDGPELALGALKGSLIHPPGYPLYSWLSSLLVRIFPCNPYHSLACFSALAQAGAVAVLLLTLTQLSGSLIVGTSLAISFGLFEGTVRTGVDAELFAMHHLLASMLIGFACLLVATPKTSRFAPGAISITLGLALAHHFLVLIYVPLAIGLVISSGRWREVLRVLWVAPVIAGAFYLSLFQRYLHAPDLAFAPLNSAMSFISYVMRGGYGTISLYAGGPGGEVSFSNDVLARVFAGLPAASILALMILPLVLRSRDPKFSWGAGSLALALLFAYGLRLPPPREDVAEWVMRFYPTVALTAALLGSLCFSCLRRARLPAAILIALVSSVSLWIAVPGVLARADASTDSVVEDEVDEALLSAPQNAVVLIASDRLAFGLSYKQHAMRLRPDVVVVVAGMLESEFYRDRTANALHVDASASWLQDISLLGNEVAALGLPVYAEAIIPVPAGISSTRPGLLARWTAVNAPTPVPEELRQSLRLFCSRWPSSVVKTSAFRARSKAILEEQFIRPVLLAVQAPKQAQFGAELSELTDVQSARDLCVHALGE